MNTKNKNRPKGKQHRTYHRVSTFTPDQHAFINYLRQRGYNSTLKAFQQQLQSNSRELYQQIINMIDQKESLSVDKFKSCLGQLKKIIGDDLNQFVKLQFMLNVWYCCHNSIKIPKQKANMLRNYIQKNGMKLSQFPQLLPYFALPYIQQPMNHPFLCKIYTKQWKFQIRKIADNCYKNQNQYKSNYQANQQNEWFTVVKDLVQICMFFDKQSINKSKAHIQMLQRVKKYQKVIQDNDNSAYIQGQSLKPSELSRLVFISQSNPQNNLPQKSERSIGQVSSAHENIIQPISYLALKQSIKKMKYTSAENQRQLCLIFYALHERIKQTQSLIGKKYIINQYVQNDILLLKQPQIKDELFQQIQCLKFINTLCFTNNSIKYLSTSQTFINILCNIVIKSKDIYIKNSKTQFTHSKNVQNLDSFEQKLLQTLGILQKISFNTEVYKKILKTDLTSNLLLGYLPCFQIIPINVLTYVLALILNIILHKQGKLMCSSIKCQIKQSSLSLFQVMIKIWKYVLKINEKLVDDRQFLEQQPQFQLQSLVYSIFYVLLGLNSNKNIAKSVNFKQILIKFMAQHNDQYHIKIGKYMIEVLQSKQQIGQQQQNLQQNQQDEFDNDLQYFDQIKGFIWIGDKLTQIQQKLKNNIESILQPFYEQNQKNINKQSKVFNDINQNFYNNASEPMFLKISKPEAHQNQYVDMKKQNSNKKLEQDKSEQFKKNFSNFDQASGYDPSKYQGWKRLKTNM